MTPKERMSGEGPEKVYRVLTAGDWMAIHCEVAGCSWVADDITEDIMDYLYDDHYREMHRG